MGIEVKFIMVRPNKDTDFWWETADAEVTIIREKINELASSQGITRTSNKSDDGLTYESRFFPTIVGQWSHFMNTVIIEIPDMIEKRNAYLAAAGHTIQMIITDVETDAITKSSTSPSWVLPE